MNEGQKHMRLEDQLDILARCGISLLPGRTVDELLDSFEREQYEQEPFTLLLMMLGSEVETGPGAGARFSDAVWTLDTECIEDRGDYARIAKRMRALAKGDLPIEDIKDRVDLEEGVAWLSFRIDGRVERWEATVDDDWIDQTILSRFAALLASRGSPRRFFYLDLGGQNILIGCATEPQFNQLREATGLDFQWLS